MTTKKRNAKKKGGLVKGPGLVTFLLSAEIDKKQNTNKRKRKNDPLGPCLGKPDKGHHNGGGGAIGNQMNRHIREGRSRSIGMD